MFADICFTIILIFAAMRLGVVMHSVNDTGGMPTACVAFFASLAALTDRYFGWLSAIGRMFS